MDSALERLAREYKSRSATSHSDRLGELYAQYVKRREDSLVDTAAVASSIGILAHDGVVDYSALTPQAEEAFHLAYPHLTLDSLSGLSAHQLQGVMSGWKGKLFEVLVRDRLNSGCWVGDLHLHVGQQAALAHSLVQPGWDLQITDPGGHIASELQLKASESLAYAKSALEHYPNIDVITTHEAASRGAEAVRQILDSGMSDHDLSDAVSAPLDQLSDHGFVGFVDDVAPFIPFVVIVATEGRRILIGKKSFKVAVHHAMERALKTGTAMAVGIIVIWLDGGLLSIPASILTRIGIDRYLMAGTVAQQIRSRLVQTRALLPKYC